MLKRNNYSILVWLTETRERRKQRPSLGTTRDFVPKAQLPNWAPERLRGGGGLTSSSEAVRLGRTPESEDGSLVMSTFLDSDTLFGTQHIGGRSP